MSQNVLKKCKICNCFKRNNILKTIMTSFTSFTTHFCYFVIAITTHVSLCDLDILLMFDYMILKLYLDSAF